ncbi:putative transaldolase [Trachymyrmex cornetzi]|uniref:transaldolase n=1 Tax=Trachymyrmex cornetzi TaxID=471704 RepID=A0A195EBY4_9HYME|nr:putative transaldolase [Trachymyrmex cornetzi]
MSEPQLKKTKTMSSLNQLKDLTTIVADTGDFQAMEQFKPTDATTNPSLILAAANQKKYAHLIEKAAAYGKKSGSTLTEQVEAALDITCVLFGKEILNIIPGRVSTEVDARLSFNKEASIEKAKRLIALYEGLGVSKERILIKLASTWEGIQAAKIGGKVWNPLQSDIVVLFYPSRCLRRGWSYSYFAVCWSNLGLNKEIKLFRYVANTDKKSYEAKEDPGVVSVTQIYNYYKKFGYKTVVMGASFRNVGEIKELAGCDFLTINPNLLDELEKSNEAVHKVLSVESAKKCDLQKISLDEAEFRWLLNEDQMSTDKLCEGIRKFTVDVRKLEKLLQEKILSIKSME